MAIRKPLSTIGSKEQVDFPELSLSRVPAKIDTGADVSSIWACNIHELPDGSLSLQLFGEGSKFFTGQPLIVKQFGRKFVKNSSGHEQLRYMVKLSIVVKGRRIKAWFTLADRSKMKYPILLGRRLLKNKFIVDVGSALRQGSNSRSVLVIGSTMPDETFLDHVRALLTHEAHFTAWRLTDLAFRIETNNVSVYHAETKQNIADFDLVYFKSHKRFYELAIATAEYLRFHHVRFFDEELLTHISYDKLSESVRLALHGVPVPLTYCAAKPVLERLYPEFAQELGWPLVYKEINADRAHKNYLLADSKQMAADVESSTPEELYILQQFIPNDGYVRALVFDSKVALAIQRDTVVHSDPRRAHLNAPQGSANAHLLSGQKAEPVERIALTAANIMRRQVAGVDLIQDQNTKQWLVLEVNSAPQLYTGAFPEAKEQAFAQFIDTQLE